MHTVYYGKKIPRRTRVINVPKPVSFEETPVRVVKATENDLRCGDGYCQEYGCSCKKYHGTSGVGWRCYDCGHRWERHRG